MKLVRIAVTCLGLVYATQMVAAPGASESRIKELVAQLGDADFAKREAATKELKEIGKPALLALKAVENHEDPEVRVRATELLQAIDPAPTAVTSGNRIGGTIVMRVGGNAGGRLNLNTKSAFAKDGKSYEIERTTKDGVSKIEVTIKEPGKDGKEIERVVEAENDEDLAKKDPELAKIVAENSAKQGVVKVQFGGGMIVDNGRAIVDAPPQLLGVNLSHFGIKAQDDEQGPRLTEVTADSQAAKLGLKEGDLLTKVNEKAVKSAREIAITLRRVKETDPLTIEILRADKPVTLKRP